MIIIMMMMMMIMSMINVIIIDDISKWMDVFCFVFFLVDDQFSIFFQLNLNFHMKTIIIIYYNIYIIMRNEHIENDDNNFAN